MYRESSRVLQLPQDSLPSLPFNTFSQKGSRILILFEIHIKKFEVKKQKQKNFGENGTALFLSIKL